MSYSSKKWRHHIVRFPLIKQPIHDEEKVVKVASSYTTQYPTNERNVTQSIWIKELVMASLQLMLIGEAVCSMQRPVAFLRAELHALMTGKQLAQLIDYCWCLRHTRTCTEHQRAAVVWCCHVVQHEIQLILLRHWRSQWWKWDVRVH